MNLSKVVGDFVGDQKSINAQLRQRIDSVENTLNKRMDVMLSTTEKCYFVDLIIRVLSTFE